MPIGSVTQTAQSTFRGLTGQTATRAETVQQNKLFN